MHATYLALIQGQSAKAYALQSKAAVARTDPVEAYALARLSQELGREDELPALCSILQEHADYCLFSAYQIARDLVRRNKTVETAAAEACVGLAQRYKQLVVDLLSDSGVSSSVPPSRHIAICGTSFCGSTLLDRLLNGMDGAHSIGESHWLTKAYDGKRATTLDFLDPFSRFVPQCSVCGPNCEVLTPRFRAALAADPKDWYFKIAARLGTRTLISADKNLPKLALNDPQFRCDTLILFKSPKQAWASELVKRPPGESNDESFEQMRRYMSMWRSSYTEMLDVLAPKGVKVYVNFDYLTLNPEFVLRSVASALSLAFEARALQQSIPGHSIGGNAGSMRRLRQTNYAVRIEKLEAPAIPADHAAWIDGNPDINRLYHELNERMIDGLSVDPGAPLGRSARLESSSSQVTVAGESISADTGAPGIAAAAAQQPIAAAPAVQVAPVPAEPVLTLPTFPIPTIPEEWLEGIFQDFGQQMRAAAASIVDVERQGLRLRRQLFEYLAENFDSEAYAVLQRRHLVQSETPQRYNEIKYLDTVRWIDGKLSHAAELRLHRLPPLDIADLGTGPGHFQVVAEHFGHRTVGLDIPLKPRLSSAERHLYDDLCDFFRVKKHAFGIEAMKPLPDLGMKFDLVTSFMTWFNSHPDNSPWSCDEWSFFLCDVRDRILKPRGRLYMNLVKEALSPEVWTFLSARATQAIERNSTLLFDDLSQFETVSAAA